MPTVGREKQGEGGRGTGSGVRVSSHVTGRSSPLLSSAARPSEALGPVLGTLWKEGGESACSTNHPPRRSVLLRGGGLRTMGRTFNCTHARRRRPGSHSPPGTFHVAEICTPADVRGRRQATPSDKRRARKQGVALLKLLSFWKLPTPQSHRSHAGPQEKP